MNTTVNGSEAEEVSRIRIAAYYVGLPSHFSSTVVLSRPAGPFVRCRTDLSSGKFEKHHKTMA